MHPDHDFYMHRCIQLALNGLGRVAPNPLVGAVIVLNDRIIGEGFHTGYGMPHAEAEAVSRVADAAWLNGSTLYVNLEPCNHFGKTGPCSKLIVDKGIRRVVVGQADPNPQAQGGISFLRDSGVEVITGVAENESRWLNRRFNSFHERKRPWIILKWAQSTDGFVDSDRGAEDRKATWITDETCRMLVHRWRSEEQAILAGSRTVLRDNPRLNVRAWTGQDPLRMTIDRRGTLSGHPDSRKLHLLDGTIPTVIYTHRPPAVDHPVDVVSLDPDRTIWAQVFEDCLKRGIQSILVEGGPTLIGTLVQEDLWDEARVFIGPGWIGSGVKAPDFPFTPAEESVTGNSRLLRFYRESPRNF